MGMGQYVYNQPIHAKIINTDDFVVSDQETLRHATIRFAMDADARKDQTVQHLYSDFCKQSRGPAPSPYPRPTMSEERFKAAFPFHIIYDQNLTIKTCGNTLQKLCPGMKPGAQMSQVCEMIYPRVQFSFHTWLDYFNVTFIVFVKPHAGSIPQGLLLKGDLYNVGLIVLCRLCKSSAFDLKTPTFINGKTELFQGICIYTPLVLVNAVFFTL